MLLSEVATGMQAGKAARRTRAVAPSKAESRQLERLRVALQAAQTQKRRLRLLSASGEELVVPSSVSRALRSLVEEMSEGHTVALVASHRELTTQEAADLLNVSRPHLVKLLDEEAMPSHRAGTHRRVRLDDLLRYKARRDAARRKTLKKLTRESQKLGLKY